MKKIILKKPGGLKTLHFVEAGDCHPGVGEVCVNWKASSLNYHDLLVALGAIEVAEDQIPMSDGAGEIIAVGEGVTQWQPGDKVMSLFFPKWHNGAPTPHNTAAVTGDTILGTATQRQCLSADAITRMPNGYSFEQAATLPCAALTSWRGLVSEGGLKAGDTVLIEGTGGMSIFGLQIAKAAGAYVYATSSSDEKLEKLKALGADHVINYKTDENWGASVAKHSGGGVDHVLDAGGGATLQHSIMAAKMGGNISLIGVLGGFKAEILLPLVFGKHLRLTGIAVGSAQQQLDMVAAIEANHMAPVIDTSFPLEKLAEAFAYQQSGAHFGKITVSYE
ncbi:NAD(P)-dependent alcohol dehydrogenase [Alphaproteobacteria bacterium]|nr:NAD(P)-dependent alcohol dehydrogenase [Alphaproteobacteria bacterium]